MNTGLIKKTKTLRYPDNSNANKTSRVITRAYTNLVMYMDRDQLALLSWLIFHCGMDNTIKYNTQLLKRYVASINAVEGYFNVKTELKTALQSARQTFKILIEEGYVISYGDKLVLNPLLSYQSDYVTSKGYSILLETPMAEIAGKYVQMVNEKVYGKAYKHKAGKKV